MSSWRFLWAAVALAALVGVGCTGHEPEKAARVAGVPVLSRSLQRPGAPIGDGFTVPPASYVLGRPFPITDLDPGHGWTAYLVVTGDPYAAIASLRRDATALGITTRATRPEGICQRTVADRFDCEVQGWMSNPANSEGVVIEYHRWPEPAISLLTVRYQHPRSAAGEPWMPLPNPDGPAVPPPELPPASAWRLLSRPGDRLRAARTAAADLRLADHTRLVAPTANLGGRTTAVLAVDGDPVKAVQRYARQFADRHLERTSLGDITQNGLRIVEARYNTESGVGIAEAVAAPGKPAYLLLIYSPDPRAFPDE